MMIEFEKKYCDLLDKLLEGNTDRTDSESNLLVTIFVFELLEEEYDMLYEISSEDFGDALYNGYKVKGRVETCDDHELSEDDQKMVDTLIFQNQIDNALDNRDKDEFNRLVKEFYG